MIRSRTSDHRTWWQTQAFEAVVLGGLVAGTLDATDLSYLKPTAILALFTTRVGCRLVFEFLDRECLALPIHFTGVVS